MKVRRFIHRSRRDEELVRELDTHIAHEAEEMIARGMAPEAAMAAARRRVGNVTTVREVVYEMNSPAAIEGLWRDLRHGVRLLGRSAWFTTAAVLSLALGIGANSTVYQLLNAIRVRSLAVPKAEELVSIHVSGEGRSGRHTGRNREVSSPLWQQLNREQKSFSSLVAFGDTRFNLAPQGEVRYVEGLWVSGSFFSVLGVAPHLGRFFTPEDDRPGCGYAAAVISHSLWQREFNGASDVIGNILTIGSYRVPIIGVTPGTFFGVEVGRRFDVALPVCAAGFERRDHFWLALMGRLRPGWSLEQANAHLQSLAPTILAETVPTDYRPDGVKKYLALRFEARPAASGVSPLRTRYEDSLWVLLAITGLVLMIASANLANLMLARAAARQQEFALRLSLGASRRQLAHQVLVEGLLLVVLGTLSGLLLARWAGGVLVSMISTGVDPIYLDLSMDWRMLAVTSAVAGLTCLVFSSAPALQAGRAAAGIRPGGRGLTVSRGGFAFRRVLMAAQVAISFVLVFSALLFTRSLRNLASIEAGFQQDGILIANLFFRENDLPLARREPFYRELTAQLRAIPGVDGIASASHPPLGGGFWDTNIAVHGQVRGASNVNQVSAGYFSAMGAPLLSGRDFGPQDTMASPRVAVVNQTFARRLLNTTQPVGQTFAMPGYAGQPDTVYQVVGFAKDSKYSSMREDFQPIAFIASAQDPSPGLTRRYVLRSSGSLSALMSSVNHLVARASPGTAIRFAVFKTQIAESLLRERFVATLSGVFGGVALVLAIVGMYGVLSYIVAKRRNEIGLRMALGADPSRILRMVFADVGTLLAAGLAAGLAGALLSARVAETLLYGLEPHDPTTLLFTSLVLTVAGLAATFWPALRASTLEPSEALRES